MNRLVKVIVGSCLIAGMALMGTAANFPRNTAPAQDMPQSYTREKVKSALLRYERIGVEDEITESVLLPASMGIELPNLNPERILNDTPLKEFGDCQSRCEALKAHGCSISNPEDLPFWKYEQIAAEWKLDAHTARALKASDPTLENEDLSQWTNATYRHYLAQQSCDRSIAPKTLRALEQRGIQQSDIPALIKRYGSPEEALRQTDAALKADLMRWYELKLTLTLGADWRESARA